MHVLNSRVRFGSHLGLERITLVCRELGNPHGELRFVHVAGTNGKGSVCAFLTKALMAAGYKVGRFTSPHLVSYNERITVNDQPISDADLSQLGAVVERACQAVEARHPSLGMVTEFEYGTALAFLYFQQMAVDVVVLETGLGGRLDATNVVTPEICVITPIGHDHMDRLGPTLIDIAWEKAGIMKAGVPVVVGFQRQEVYEALWAAAHCRETSLSFVARWDYEPLGWDMNGGALRLPQLSPQPFSISLLGDHQLDNAATAALALHHLNARGWQVEEEHIRQGLAEAKWPGRLEVVSPEPLVVLDGAHNQESMATLANGLRHLQGSNGGKEWTIVFGMLGNKDLALLDFLLPLAKRFIFTQADSGRLEPMPPERMAAYVRERGAEAEICLPAVDALRAALAAPPICVCGSLYLVGTIKRDLAHVGIVTQ